MKKVLFLDIDGVLNCERTRSAFGGFPRPNDFNFLPNPILGESGTYHKLDFVAISMIRNLCKEYSIDIVLSSSWRKVIDFETLASVLDLPIIDKTVSSNESRGYEIQRYTDEHDIDLYCILDDDDDFYQYQKPFFVQTTFENGFLYEHLLKIKQIFRFTKLIKYDIITYHENY